jgi:hypothetical protein
MYELKVKILNLIEDSVSDLLYYDRKNCEYVSLEEITSAIKDKIITLDEMVDKFRECLMPNFESL